MNNFKPGDPAIFIPTNQRVIVVSELKFGTLFTPGDSYVTGPFYEIEDSGGIRIMHRGPHYGHICAFSYQLKPIDDDRDAEETIKEVELET